MDYLHSTLAALSIEPRDQKYYRWLLNGWLMTLGVSAVVIVIGTVFGALFVAARSSASVFWLRASALYLSVFRNTPLLVQLFFWYFGAASLIPQSVRGWLYEPHQWALADLVVKWPSFEFLSAAVGLTLYATAFIGEEIRAGLRGVASGQRDAAKAIGLTSWQSLRYIVLPQAFRIATPALLGQYMNTIKNTSLTMAIGVVELSATARQVEADTFRTFHAFAIATLLYILTITALELFNVWLKRRHALAWSGR